MISERIRGRQQQRLGQASESPGTPCEIVSPNYVYANIEAIQQIVRLLRKESTNANNSCGIHIHINAAPYAAQSLRNLANIFASREDMLVDALGIEAARTHYCQKADPAFMNRLNTSKPATRDQIKSIWYNGRDESMIHYSATRYRMLNFHSVFSKGTVEFRCFNSTTHAGEIKAMIYIMNKGHPAPPSVGYLDTIERGYRAVGFHMRYLAERVRRIQRRKAKHGH